MVSESFGTISEFFFLTLRSIQVFGPVRLYQDFQKVKRITLRRACRNLGWRASLRFFVFSWEQFGRAAACIFKALGSECHTLR